MSDRIKEIISDQGFQFSEKSRTISTECPICNRSDKFSILKENGSCICYRGSCDFGRRWFEDWLSLTANIPIEEAKRVVKGRPESSRTGEIKIYFGKAEKPKEEEIPAIEWPPYSFLPITDKESVEGLEYLKKRGIPLTVAIEYDIRYSPFVRRVVLPIVMDGKCYGWQARAIDKVEDKDRMRNNQGFRKDSVLMFHDNLSKYSSGMLFEGPFDAMKFNKLGGIVCSMGKNISNKQVDLINKSKISVLYLGLDADAAKESSELVRKIEKPIRVLSVPESCIERCKELGKKADFGECNPSEILEAFKTAKDYSKGFAFVYLK
jgi:hypothetical protein